MVPAGSSESGGTLPDAEDEVALLRVQQEGKAAEAKEAQALLKKAQHQLARLQQLRRNGAVGEDEVESARTEVEVQEARLLGRRAQLKEADLRLQQAERRLTGLRRRPERPTAAAGAQPALPPTAVLPSPGSQPGYPSTMPLPPTGTVRPGQELLPSTERESERRLRKLEDAVERLAQELQDLRRQLVRPEGTRPSRGRPHDSKQPDPLRTAPPGGPAGGPLGLQSPPR
jgi:hypothetical protein